MQVRVSTLRRIFLDVWTLKNGRLLGGVPFFSFRGSGFLVMETWVVLSKKEYFLFITPYPWVHDRAFDLRILFEVGVAAQPLYPEFLDSPGALLRLDTLDLPFSRLAKLLVLARPGAELRGWLLQARLFQCCMSTKVGRCRKYPPRG